MPDLDESEGDILTLSEDQLLAEEEAINLSKKPLDEILGTNKLSESEAIDNVVETDNFAGETDDWSNVIELPVNEKAEGFDDLQDEAQRDSD